MNAMSEEKKNETPSEPKTPESAVTPISETVPSIEDQTQTLTAKSKKGLIGFLVALGVVVSLMTTFLAIGFTEASKKNTTTEQADAGTLVQGFFDKDGKKITKGGAWDFVYTDGSTPSFSLKLVQVLSEEATTLVLPYAWANEESGNNAYYVTGSEDCASGSNLFAHDAKEKQITALYAERYYTKIGAYAFEGLSSLTTFAMGNSSISGATSSWGDYAFSKNPLLSKVVLPNVLTSLGVGVFSECPLLSSVTYGGTKSDWAKVTLGENWKDATLKTIVCTDGSLSL